MVRDQTGLLHIWYNGVGPQKSFRVGHATSRDGVHWTRQNGGNPVLEPSTLGRFEEDYVYNVMVLLEDDTYHVWYSAILKTPGANPRKQHVPESSCIVHASSRDGTHWTKDKVPTLLNGPADSIDAYAAFACYVVRHPDGLWMYYSAGSRYQRYKVALATQH